jgi:hypothetical protein
MADEHNVEVMRRLAELWGRGEYEAIPELLHEDGRWISRGQASGIENVLDFGVLVDFDEGLIRRLEFFREPAAARQEAGA